MKRHILTICLLLFLLPLFLPQHHTHAAEACGGLIPLPLTGIPVAVDVYAGDRLYPRIYQTVAGGPPASVADPDIYIRYALDDPNAETQQLPAGGYINLTEDHTLWVYAVGDDDFIAHYVQLCQETAPTPCTPVRGVGMRRWSIFFWCIAKWIGR